MRPVQLRFVLVHEDTIYTRRSWGQPESAQLRFVMLLRPDGRSVRFGRRPDSAPRDAEFLLHRTASSTGSSTDCTAVASTAEKDFRSVHISIRLMTARNTLELRLTPAARVIDVTADGAHLR